MKRGTIPLLILLGSLIGLTAILIVPPDLDSALTGVSDPSPQIPVEDRANVLLAQMTLEEKIGQVTLVEKNSISPEEVTRFAIGAVLSGGGGNPYPNTPQNWYDMVEAYQLAALDTRLGIPLLYGADGIHGHNNVAGAVIFPHAVGLGATRNPALVEEVGRITAIEMAATGVYWDYAPVVAVLQDIRWGRSYEAFGEDTGLVILLSEAYIRGLQGVDLRDPLTVVATPKHYVADGGTLWGSARAGYLDQGDAPISEETLRLIHLPPYQAAIDQGALSIMVSYSSWQGEKMHGHDYLLTDILKGELGFEGFLVSDWEAIDQINVDYYQAVVEAFNAGIDMNMVPRDYELFIDTLAQAVENGDVPMERLDDAVRRILTVKAELGLFDNPYPPASLIDEVGSDAHREVAREAVRQSLVLLKNDNDVLPLSKESPVIFLGGAAADITGYQAGGWTIEWQGVIDHIPGATSVRGAVENAVSPETDVYFDRAGRFDDVVDESANPVIAEVGIAVIAENPYAESKGDSLGLALSPDQAALIAEMRPRSRSLIAILFSGRPVIITDLLDEPDAFVAAWLPGSEAQGITDVLFGDYPFTGHLPYTWPRSVDQLPFDFSNLPIEGCDAALFPFGYGLTKEDTVTLSLPVCD